MPWHLGDQHNHQKKTDLPRNGTSTNNASNNQQTCQTDQTASQGGAVLDHSLPTLPPPPGACSADSGQAPNDSQLAPAGLPAANASTSSTCDNTDSTVGNAVGAAGGTSEPNQATGDQSSTSTLGNVGSVSAPTPYAPRHGVRIDAGAGPGGSVVYQRYCHMYAEGELEGLVESVDGLRVVKSYYDRSNWCVVAEREV